MTVEPIAIGFFVGFLLWRIFMRPLQLDHHERRRRELGLPRKRELPEDHDD